MAGNILIEQMKEGFFEELTIKLDDLKEMLYKDLSRRIYKKKG